MIESKRLIKLFGKKKYITVFLITFTIFFLLFTFSLIIGIIAKMLSIKPLIYFILFGIFLIPVTVFTLFYINSYYIWITKRNTFDALKILKRKKLDYKLRKKLFMHINKIQYGCSIIIFGYEKIFLNALNNVIEIYIKPFILFDELVERKEFLINHLKKIEQFFAYQNYDPLRSTIITIANGYHVHGTHMVETFKELHYKERSIRFNWIVVIIMIITLIATIFGWFIDFLIQK